MIARVEKFPKPEPDFERLRAVLHNRKPDRVPLLELAIDPAVLGSALGKSLPPWQWDLDDTRARACLREHIAAHRRLGYDFFRVAARVPFDLKLVQAAARKDVDTDRQWSDSARGAVTSMEDVERYPWPRPTDDDLRFARAALAELPPDMGCIAFCGGLFEFASQLVGMEKFFVDIYTDPHFVRAVIDRVGAYILETFETFCAMDRVGALWLGDDLGSKNATFVDPAFLKEIVFPWYARFARVAHDAGRPFMLHSCGNLAAIMDDLIALGVDAKHSYEDAIMPVEQVKKRWGDRVAVLGGVDVDLLARASEDQVRRRTREILEACAPAGGYAAGSGNSIANYVEPGNYLAMLETVHAYNGRMEPPA